MSKWMTPEEIRDTDIGLSYEEHLEMAYENVVAESDRLRKELRATVGREKHWQKVAGKLASFCNSIYLAFDRDRTESDKQDAHDKWLESLEYLEMNDG